MLHTNDSDNTTCLNCEKPVRGNYCENCGQKVIKPYRSFPYLVKELLGSYFNFDSSLYRTLFTLLLRPGQLTIEYAKGRRTRFIHPIRLYVFTSLIFFLIFIPLSKQTSFNASLSVGDDNADLMDSINVDSAKNVINLPDSLYILSNSFPVFDTKEEMGNYIDSLPKNERPGLLTKALIFKTIELKDKSQEEANKEFYAAFLQNIPKMLFLLLPFFALLLKLFYWRQKFYFEEYLVFSFHTHIFLFILILISLLVSFLSQLVAALLFLAVLWYLIVSQIIVFKQRKWLIVLKTFGIAILYLFIISFVSILNVLYSFLTY